MIGYALAAVLSTGARFFLMMSVDVLTTAGPD